MEVGEEDARAARTERTPFRRNLRRPTVAPPSVHMVRPVRHIFIIFSPLQLALCSRNPLNFYQLICFFFIEFSYQTDLNSLVFVLSLFSFLIIVRFIASLFYNFLFRVLDL